MRSIHRIYVKWAMGLIIVTSPCLAADSLPYVSVAPAYPSEDTPPPRDTRSPAEVTAATAYPAAHPQLQPIASASRAPEAASAARAQSAEAPPAPSVEATPAPDPLAAVTQGLSPKEQEGLAQLQAMLNRPGVRAVLAVFSSPEVAANATQLIESPDRGKFMILEIAFFFLISLFQGWRLSLVESWQGKLWIRTYCFFLLWGALAGAVPMYVFGQPYISLVQGISLHFMQ